MNLVQILVTKNPLGNGPQPRPEESLTELELITEQERYKEIDSRLKSCIVCLACCVLVVVVIAVLLSVKR